jgi:hypothetical protein
MRAMTRPYRAGAMLLLVPRGLAPLVAHASWAGKRIRTRRSLAGDAA